MKIMKNILKLTAVVALMATLFTGCIKETFPTSGATQEQVVESPYALEAMVAGINAAMIIPDFSGTGDHCDFGYPSMMIMRDVMLDIAPLQGNVGYDWFSGYGMGLDFQAEGSGMSMVWNTYYPLIYSCNDVIRMLKGADSNLQYLGIAYAFRAMFYLDLVRMYEFKENPYTTSPETLGLAVPIVNEDTTEEMAAHNPRATVDEVYAFIFQDLAYAEQYLEAYTPSSRALPGLDAVYGLYARAYLERAAIDPATNYPKAAEYARKAIDASGCTPLTQAQWEDPANGFNSMASQNSWILGITQTSENVSNLLSFTAWMAPEQEWGYATVTGGRIYYAIAPSLYKSIPNSDFRKHSWIDPAGLEFHNYKLCYPDAALFWESVQPYTPIKFRPAGGEISDYKSGNATDIPLMRVEEMLLIEAEAEAYTNLAKGQQLLTDFMSHRILNGSYICSHFTSFETFRLEVIKQKKIEFWGEGILYFDYKRLGLGLKRTGSDSIYQDDYYFDADGVAPFWNLTIPRSEIQNNAGISDELNNPNPSGVLKPAVSSSSAPVGRIKL